MYLSVSDPGPEIDVDSFDLEDLADPDIPENHAKVPSVVSSFSDSLLSSVTSDRSSPPT